MGRERAPRGPTRSPAVASSSGQTGVTELRNGDAPRGRDRGTWHGARCPMDVPSRPSFWCEAGGRWRWGPFRQQQQQEWRFQSCLEVRAASKSLVRSPPPLRRSGRLHPPALDAPGPPCCFPSWLPRLLCLLAAVVVDSWPCGRSGAQTGGCGRVASCAVGRSRLAELRWPSASAAEGLSMLLLHAARVGC